MLGGFASCVAIQAGTSRLMFVMGRDNVLPRPAPELRLDSEDSAMTSH